MRLGVFPLLLALVLPMAIIPMNNPSPDTRPEKEYPIEQLIRKCMLNEKLKTKIILLSKQSPFRVKFSSLLPYFKIAECEKNKRFIGERHRDYFKKRILILKEAHQELTKEIANHSDKIQQLAKKFNKAKQSLIVHEEELKEEAEERLKQIEKSLARTKLKLEEVTEELDENFEEKFANIKRFADTYNYLPTDFYKQREELAQKTIVRELQRLPFDIELDFCEFKTITEENLLRLFYHSITLIPAQVVQRIKTREELSEKAQTLIKEKNSTITFVRD